MTDPEVPGRPRPTPTATPSPRGGWATSLLIFFCTLPLFLINRADPAGVEDTIPSEVLPLLILRGEWPNLDRLSPLLLHSAKELPPSLTWVGPDRRVMSRYAPGGPFLNLPVVAALTPLIDRVEPAGWDGNVGLFYLRAMRMTKVSDAFVVALTGLFLHRILRNLGVAGWPAALATLATTLGSDLWGVASQAAWEHGPAAFLLTFALWMLTPRPLTRWRATLAGLAAGWVVACRPLDLILVAGLIPAVGLAEPRRLAWFLPGFAGFISALLGYNLWFFGTPMGGLAELEALHPILHGRDGTFSGNLLEGLAGTLFSPNRGLFVFCPWVPVALVLLPLSWPKIRQWLPGVWVLGSLGVFGLVISKYSVWWGGHCFGPRYWTEAMPIFGILFGLGLGELRRFRKPTLFGATLLVAWSIGLQAIGAFCWPSSWNDLPVNVDKTPERVWDWADNEIARCLKEGVKPWSEYDDGLWHFPGRSAGRKMERRSPAKAPAAQPR